jgi:4-alpha-glucanotransferase
VTPPGTTLVAEARRRLDIRQLALSIHDASFPAHDLDSGRGTPYSSASHSLAERVAALGFDVIQLGPQGESSPDNPSPYDTTAFSRSSLSIDLSSLLEKDTGSLLTREELLVALDGRPAVSAQRADHRFAWRVQGALLQRAFRRLREGRGAGASELRSRIDAFSRANQDWLARDGLYEALAELHGDRGFRQWPEPDRRLPNPEPGERPRFERRRREIERRFPERIAFHGFTQYLAHAQHARFRQRLHGLGLRVYGDLQIGLADRDVWALEPLFLHDYRLGAPPSRTNPDGQAWGYPVFDPARYRDGDAEGPVIRSLRRRLDLAFEAYDGLRIDHPHGLVCPWLYRATAPRSGEGSAAEAESDALVREGARLFSAAGVPGHPSILAYDIARPEQIDREREPWADGRVRDLDPEQVDRYAILFDEVVAAAERSGVGAEGILCEVLSTLPFPLERVMARFGLGRFRVTSKLDPEDPKDPYRIEAAGASDWLMIGTHDTPSIWGLLATWDEPRRRARAVHAAERLEPDPIRRARFAETLVRDPGLLAQALLAEMFSCAARNVLVFFSDLFGIVESYNQPGTVSAENWSLRLPRDFQGVYRERLARHRALDLRLALALALRAKPEGHGDLVRALLDEAAREAPIPELFTERA